MINASNTHHIWCRCPEFLLKLVILGAHYITFTLDNFFKIIIMYKQMVYFFRFLGWSAICLFFPEFSLFFSVAVIEAPKIQTFQLDRKNVITLRSIAHYWLNQWLPNRKNLRSTQPEIESCSDYPIPRRIPELPFHYLLKETYRNAICTLCHLW